MSGQAGVLRTSRRSSGNLLLSLPPTFSSAFSHPFSKLTTFIINHVVVLLKNFVVVFLENSKNSCWCLFEFHLVVVQLLVRVR